MSIKDWIITKLGGYTSNEYSKLNKLYKTTHKEKEDALIEIERLTNKGTFELIARNLLIAFKIYEDKEFINCAEEDYPYIVGIAYEIKWILENCYKDNLTSYEEFFLEKIKEMESPEYKKRVSEKQSKGYEIFLKKQKGEMEK
ncbi:hypothetical protein ACOL3G_04825 [Aliarcobacter butzleri]|uniref:hypothetical protein n=1 Tax=Aliarcobacter butzleri TaxID=28197 RepID=UPI001260534B|nr:hypothetical protein [Aliarcobacter butzleri]